MVHDHVFVSVRDNEAAWRKLKTLIGSSSNSFPLSLVFRIYDIVFAEGIEAVFRFSLALLQINEKHLLELDFEGCLKFLQGGLFDAYKVLGLGFLH